ncbi:MAG: hypothetical protein AB9846_07345 [Tenuifilaceae bacterium]
MRPTLLLLFFLAATSFLKAQVVIDNPAVAEQNHQELVIIKIELYKDSTIVNLSVENKLAQGGWFCTDRNTYVEEPKSRLRYNLLKAKGIPYCPSVHSFKKIGEKLYFTLVFPGIPSGTKRINIIENCDKACFSFKGVILDNKLNNDINLYTKGVELYAANSLNEAIDCFTKVVETIPEFPTHVYGYSYFNLIRIYADKGDKLTSRFWREQLERSALPDKQYFIDALIKEKVIEK